MRRAARTDANHATVMLDLRRLGYRVEDMSQVGGGVPDLLVGTPCGALCLVEVKDGAKPPSKRVLTEDQVKWHLAWGKWPVFVALSAADAHEKIRTWLDSLATR